MVHRIIQFKITDEHDGQEQRKSGWFLATPNIIQKPIKILVPQGNLSGTFSNFAMHFFIP